MEWIGKRENSNPKNPKPIKLMPNLISTAAFSAISSTLALFPQNIEVPTVGQVIIQDPIHVVQVQMDQAIPGLNCACQHVSTERGAGRRD